jgi:Rps23 Pro-64 3,4-dihydroxylase Tpa1-like proline 4-hydroxylase
MKTLNLKELEIDFNNVVDNKIKNILYLRKKFNKNKIKLLVLNNFLSIKYPKYFEKNFFKPNNKTDLNSKKNQIGKHIVNEKRNKFTLSKNDIFLKNLFYKKKFLFFLKKLTKINDLSKDSNEWGSGYHQTVKGGILNRHLDPTYNLNKTLVRRINVLYYFNSNWKKKYKGYLSLWDNKFKKKPNYCFAPTINRLIIFETSKFSWHGHAEPLNVPKNKTRKSLSLFYFSKKKGNQNPKNFDAYWN